MKPRDLRVVHPVPDSPKSNLTPWLGPRLPPLDVDSILTELSVEALTEDPAKYWGAVRALVVLVRYHATKMNILQNKN
jgi:hypothetical protein